MITKRLDAKFAKDLTSIRIVPSTNKLNKSKRSDMKKFDETTGDACMGRSSVGNNGRKFIKTGTGRLDRGGGTGGLRLEGFNTEEPETPVLRLRRLGEGTPERGGTLVSRKGRLKNHHGSIRSSLTLGGRKNTKKINYRMGRKNLIPGHFMASGDQMAGNGKHGMMVGVLIE
ncbi:hypothetical protein Tco_1370023 [Tanacetum coccineum]